MDAGVDVEDLTGPDAHAPVDEGDSVLLFLIADFLARSSPCTLAAQVLTKELEQHHLLGNAYDWQGKPRSASLQDLRRRFSTVPADQLRKLLLSRTAAAGDLEAGNSDIAAVTSLITPVLAPNARAQRLQLDDTILDLCLNGVRCRAKRRQYERRLAELLHCRSTDDSDVLVATTAAAMECMPEGQQQQPELSLLGAAKRKVELQQQLQSLTIELDLISSELLRTWQQRRQCGPTTVPCTLRPPISAHRHAAGASSTPLMPLPTALRFQSCRGVAFVKESAAAARSVRQLCLGRKLRARGTVNGHLTEGVYCVKFDRTGQYIITGADDYLVKVWSAVTGRLLHTLRGHTNVIMDLAVSHDNSALATAGADTIVRVWALMTAAPLTVLTGHTGNITGVLFESGRCVLLTTSDDGCCIVWDLRAFCEAARAAAGVECSSGISAASAAAAAAAAADYPGGAPHYIMRHAPAAYLPVQGAADSEAHSIKCLTVCSVGGCVSVGCVDGVADIWEYTFHDGDATGAAAAAATGSTRATRAAAAAALTDSSIAAGTGESADTGETAAGGGSSSSSGRSAVRSTIAAQHRAKLLGHTSAISDVCFNNQGDRALTASCEDGTARVWSWGKGFTGLRHIVLKVCHTGATADRAGGAGSVPARLGWRTAVSGRTQTARTRPPLRPRAKGAPKVSLDCAMWTCDAERIVTGHHTRAAGNIVQQWVKVWDSATGTPLSECKGHASSVNMLTHPSDPAVVITVGIDGVLRVWDIEQPGLIKPLTSFTNAFEWGPVPQERDPSNAGGPAPCLDAAISPDGVSIAMSDRYGRWTLYGTEPPFPLVHLDGGRLMGGTGGQYNGELGSGGLLSPPVPREQYFASDYHETQADGVFNVIDQRTQLPVHLAPRGSLITANGDPYPDELQPAHSALIGPLPLSLREVTCLEAKTAARVAALEELYALKAQQQRYGSSSSSGGVILANGVTLQQGRVTRGGGMAGLRGSSSSRYGDSVYELADGADMNDVDYVDYQYDSDVVLLSASDSDSRSDNSSSDEDSHTASGTRRSSRRRGSSSRRSTSSTSTRRSASASAAAAASRSARHSARTRAREGYRLGESLQLDDDVEAGELNTAESLSEARAKRALARLQARESRTAAAGGGGGGSSSSRRRATRAAAASQQHEHDGFASSDMGGDSYDSGGWLDEASDEGEGSRSKGKGKGKAKHSSSAVTQEGLTWHIADEFDTTVAAEDYTPEPVDIDAMDTSDSAAADADALSSSSTLVDDAAVLMGMSGSEYLQQRRRSSAMNVSGDETSAAGAGGIDATAAGVDTTAGAAAETAADSATAAASTDTPTVCEDTADDSVETTVTEGAHIIEKADPVADAATVDSTSGDVTVADTAPAPAAAAAAATAAAAVPATQEADSQSSDFTDTQRSTVTFASDLEEECPVPGSKGADTSAATPHTDSNLMVIDEDDSDVDAAAGPTAAAPRRAASTANTIADLTGVTRQSRDGLRCVFCHGGHSAESPLPGPELGLHPLILSNSSRVYCHDLCALRSPQVYHAEGSWWNIAKEAKRGRLIPCSSCGQKGGTIGCNVASCKKTYHYPCALTEQGAFCVPNNHFYCRKHKVGVPGLTSCSTGATVRKSSSNSSKGGGGSRGSKKRRAAAPNSSNSNSSSSSSRKQHSSRRAAAEQLVQRASTSSPEVDTPLHATVPLCLAGSLDREWLLKQGSGEEGTVYAPQIGDSVVYLPQGHCAQLEQYPQNTSPPWRVTGGHVAVCRVKALKYGFPSAEECLECGSVLVGVTLELVSVAGRPARSAASASSSMLPADSSANDTANGDDQEYSATQTALQPPAHFTPQPAGTEFTVYLRNCGLPDYIILLEMYAASMAVQWCSGMRVEADFTDEVAHDQAAAAPAATAAAATATTAARGTIIQVCVSDEHKWPTSPWECLMIDWDMPQADGTNSVTSISPWELRVVDAATDTARSTAPCSAARIAAAEAERLLSGLELLMQEPFAEPFAEPVDLESMQDYACQIPLPVDLGLICRRLRSEHYRSIEALTHDCALLLSNCTLYNREDSLIVKYSEELAVEFERLFEGHWAAYTQHGGAATDAAASTAAAAVRGSWQAHRLRRRARAAPAAAPAAAGGASSGADSAADNATTRNYDAEDAHVRRSGTSRRVSSRLRDADDSELSSTAQAPLHNTRGSHNVARHSSTNGSSSRAGSQRVLRITMAGRGSSRDAAAREQQNAAAALASRQAAAESRQARLAARSRDAAAAASVGSAASQQQLQQQSHEEQQPAAKRPRRAAAARRRGSSSGGSSSSDSDAGSDQYNGGSSARDAHAASGSNGRSHVMQSSSRGERSRRRGADNAASASDQNCNTAADAGLEVMPPADEISSRSLHVTSQQLQQQQQRSTRQRTGRVSSVIADEEDSTSEPDAVLDAASSTQRGVKDTNNGSSSSVRPTRSSGRAASNTSTKPAYKDDDSEGEDERDLQEAEEDDDSSSANRSSKKRKRAAATRSTGRTSTRSSSGNGNGNALQQQSAGRPKRASATRKYSSDQGSSDSGADSDDSGDDDVQYDNDKRKRARRSTTGPSTAAAAAAAAASNRAPTRRTRPQTTPARSSTRIASPSQSAPAAAAAAAVPAVPEAEQAVSAVIRSMLEHQRQALHDSGVLQLVVELASQPWQPSLSADVLVTVGLSVLEGLRVLDADEVFEDPVTDAIAPNYSHIVLKPLSFAEIESSLHSGAYASSDDFRDALLLVFANCMTYNATKSVFFKLAEALAREMTNIWNRSAEEATHTQ